MRKLYLIAVICTLLITTFHCAGADIIKRESRLRDIDGKVEVKLPGSDWALANPDMRITEGSKIRTGADSSAILNINGMAQTATVQIHENSELDLAELSADNGKDANSTLLNLHLGKLTIKVIKTAPDKTKFMVKTPTSMIDASEATFELTVDAMEDS